MPADKGQRMCSHRGEDFSYRGSPFITVLIRTVPWCKVTGVSKVRKRETLVCTFGCVGMADRKRGVKTVRSLHGCRDANAALSRRKKRSMLLGLVVCVRCSIFEQQVFRSCV